VALHQSAIFEDLIDVLYDLLPASGAPITIGSVAASIGLGEIWLRTAGASKKPRIREVVRVAVERRELPRLLEEVVKASLGYRRAKKSPLTYDEVTKLAGAAKALGQPVIALLDPRFLASLHGAPSSGQSFTPTRGTSAVESAPKSQPDADSAARTKASEIAQLKTRFLKLHAQANRQSAGQDLNGLLTDLFAAFSLAPSSPFRVTGEEIDGALYFEKEMYLIEAKWTATRIPAQPLYAFNEKIRRKSDFTRGIFISINGYSEEALEAYRTGASSRAVLIDGAHLMRVLDGGISLPELLERVTRALAQRGAVYLPVIDL
jgi:hypothetical protein